MLNITNHQGKTSKNQMRYHLIPVKTAIIKKTRDNRGQWGRGGKETLTHCWKEGKLVQPPWKTIWWCLNNLKLDLPSRNSASQNIPKEMKTVIQWDICTPMFTIALFTIAKIWKPPKRPSTNEWVKKIYIQNITFFTHEKGIHPAIGDSMNESWIYYVKQDKTDKDEHCSTSLICRIYRDQTCKKNNNVQKNSQQTVSWFLNRNSTSHNGKGRTNNQEYSTQQDSPSDLMEKSKAFQTSKN